MCDNDSGEGSTGNPGVEWSSLNKLFSDHSSKEDIAFGSKQWASVYLASTPQQAAAMGLKFPGVEEVLIFGRDPYVLTTNGYYPHLCVHFEN